MNQPQSDSIQTPDQATLFGHPVGLYTLFFAEMWERFSFYGMRALLVFYMMKGFLQYRDGDAYTIYGAYTTLVYMMPFFGGMLADRLLGARRAVLLGGALMAVGQAFLMVPNKFSFFGGLALLIVGNGFFKPNISNMVGVLYRKTPEKRDGGFTIFYMGINLGAAMSPLLCGYIGETYDWKYGFGLATVGMLTGLAVFWLPPLVARIMIAAGAAAAAIALLYFHPANVWVIGVGVFVALALLVSATFATVAIGRGGLPDEAGAPPDPKRLRKRILGIFPLEWVVYAAAVLIVPVVVFFVSGGAVFRQNGKPMTLVPEKTIQELKAGDGPLANVAAVCLEECSKPVGVILALSALAAFGYLIVETFRLPLIPRHHMYVVLILTFFCLLFWAFFEQAGSSLNNFTDRNVDRVIGGERVITQADVGKTIEIEPTQEQLGYTDGGKMFTLTDLDKLREEHKKRADTIEKTTGKAPELTIPWHVAPDNVGMEIARRSREIPASQLQGANPIYILILGLVFTAMWSFLEARGWEPSTPFKFALGLLQLGLGFGVIWYGTKYYADGRGMVAIYWLLLGYLLHTTGELCLSPVGLAMISKLSPARLVGTVMGAWFLATGISQFLAAVIAQFTGVGGEGKETIIPPPIDTLHVYGNVFAFIAVAAVVSSFICFGLVPLLKRWMHDGE